LKTLNCVKDGGVIVTQNSYEDRITATQHFVPAGVEVPDAVIAEIPAGIDTGEATVTGQGPGSTLPPRGQGRVPERSVADRLRERLESAG
jgi:hypothetical protein